jgi:hypothetical protein
VVLRTQGAPGTAGAAALPRPIRCTCGPGRMPLGDWSRLGVLADYSGAIRYRRNFTAASAELTGDIWLDLGTVAASAEVFLNGTSIGTLLAPPWQVRLSPHLRPGENTLEVQVCNTLANHYRCIPTRYRGDLTSGLLGPVRITQHAQHAQHG